MTTLVVLQPGYLPWLGFFDQVDQADVFVFYDDVQFDKHGWRNRNRIKTANGVQWLTVPILHKGKDRQRICDVQIDQRTPWARKHLMAIRQAYARAPNKDGYLEDLEELLGAPWEKLCDLDLAVVELMCRWLGISAETHRSSELGIEGEQSDRLLLLCRHLGADSYLSGIAAQDYLDVGLFERNGVRVVWQDFDHPEYEQLHGPFESHLSALDLILNKGSDSLATIRAARPLPAPRVPS